MNSPDSLLAHETAKQLQSENLLDDASYAKISEYEDSKFFSIHWQIKTLLFIGISVFAFGLGILIYKNIDTIGHNVIVVLIGALSLFCFAYCSWKKDDFDWKKVDAPNNWYDYVLLLGALTLVTFLGYLQFEFNVFGEHWGLATFIPFVLLAFAAYFYDHTGVASMAVVLLASWVGISVTPFELFRVNDFSSERLIYSGVGLGIFLLLLSFASEKYDLKKHFAFTYFNFGLNIAFVAALAGLFTLNLEPVWAVVISALIYYGYRYAMTQKSFYVLLISFIYGFVAFSYLMTKLVDVMHLSGMSEIYFLLFYFIFSSIMLIKYLREFRHKIQDADLR